MVINNNERYLENTSEINNAEYIKYIQALNKEGEAEEARRKFFLKHMK